MLILTAFYQLRRSHKAVYGVQVVRGVSNPKNSVFVTVSCRVKGLPAAGAH